MGKSLLPALIGGAAILGSGGLATPAVGAGAAGGTAAMGAGAAAGNALAAQGAAGLLGSAGAAAAGYGAPAALGGSIGVGAAGNAVPEAATASFGPNGEFTGNTIASELSANPYTGGYDSLNGLERLGQRVGGFFDDGGFDKVNKFKGLFGGQEQPQQQQPQDKVISGGAVQGGQEPSQMGAPVYGQGVQLTEEQKKKLYLAQMQSRGLL